MPGLVVVLVLSTSLLSRETDGSASGLAVIVTKHGWCVCARAHTRAYICMFVPEAKWLSSIGCWTRAVRHKACPVVTPLLPGPFSSLSHPAPFKKALQEVIRLEIVANPAAASPF